MGRFKLDPNSTPEEDSVRYVWTPHFDDRDDEKYHQITECIVSNYALTIKWLSWSIDGNVDKVSYRHSAKLPISKYKQILGCDDEFEAEHNAFWINRAFLHEKIPTANPLKRSLLAQKLDRLLTIYNQEDDFLDSLKVALKEMMQTERPSLVRAAAILSLTERSFKRQLNKRGVRFQDVARDIKMEFCDIYLKQDIPYSEIAQLLWYADQSAFTRAYKKWHGASPSQHLK